MDAALQKAVGRFTKEVSSAKDVEATVQSGGGKTLELNMRRAVAQVNAGTKMGVVGQGPNQGDPYFILAGSCKEPTDLEGAYVGVFYGFSADPDTWKEPKSAQQNINQFFEDMESFGYAYDEIADFEKFVDRIRKDKPQFLFGTGAKKDPKYGGPKTTFFQGALEQVSNGKPKTTTAKKKVTTEEPESDAQASGFTEGDYVLVDDGANEAWNGTIESVKGDVANVFCNSEEETYEVELQYIELTD